MIKTRISDKWHKLSPEMQQRISSSIANGHNRREEDHRSKAPSPLTPHVFTKKEHKRFFPELYAVTGLSIQELTDIDRASGTLPGEQGCVLLGDTDYIDRTFVPGDELIEYLKHHGGPCRTVDPIECFREIPSEALRSQVRQAALLGTKLHICGSTFDEWFEFQHVVDDDAIFGSKGLEASVHPDLVEAIKSGKV